MCYGKKLYIVTAFQEILACNGKISTSASRDTMQPDPNCKTCDGSGFMYLLPKATKAVTTGLTGKFDMQLIGMIKTGTAYVTALSTDLMGWRDRLTFPDFDCKFSELITFEESKLAKLRKPAKSILRLVTSFAEYSPVTALKKPCNIDDPLDVPIPDFKISDDGMFIEWLNIETYPGDEEQASILYLTSPVYIIDDLIHELRGTIVKHKYPQETFINLAKQYVAKREDFNYNRANNMPGNGGMVIGDY